jgi:hypothetical protein
MVSFIALAQSSGRVHFKTSKLSQKKILCKINEKKNAKFIISSNLNTPGTASQNNEHCSQLQTFNETRTHKITKEMIN